MRKIIFIYVSMSMASILFGAEDVSFTNQTGFAVIANVKEYQYATRKINIEVQPNAVNTHLPKLVLSDADMDLLKAIRVFCDPDLFKVSIKRIDEKTWVQEAKGGQTRQYKYSMEFINEGKIALSDVRGECCTYGKTIRTERDSIYRYAGAPRPFQIGNVGPSKRVEYQTPRSSIRETETTVTEAAGICVRVYLPVSEQYEVMREFRFPETLSEQTYPWGDVFYKGSAAAIIP